MEELGTVNFDDLFDFSPEPPTEDSTEKGQTTFGEDKYNLVNTFNSQSYSVQPQIGTNRSIEINSQSQQQQQLQPQSQEGNQFSVVQLSTSLPEPVGTKSKRGRKPGQKIVKQDMKTKLERSRQSARECRARKKLRYQYLDDILLERERANLKLREELLKYKDWCHELDQGRIPEGLNEMLSNYAEEMNNDQQQNAATPPK